MDCHTESVKNERLAMTKYINSILSYLVMFILENIKLIIDEMMYYLLEYLIETYYYPAPQAFLWASNLPLLPLFGGEGGIQINIFVWFTKRDPYNMLIGLPIASSLTPHRFSCLLIPFLNNSLKTLHNEADKGDLRFSHHFSMDKVNVEVYIFPPFFEIVDRMCVGI